MSINYLYDDPDIFGELCPICGKKSCDIFRCDKCGKVFCKHCGSEFISYEDDNFDITCECDSTTLFLGN